MSDRVLKRPVLGLVAGAATGGILVAALFTIDYATAHPVQGGAFVPTSADIVRWAAVSFVAAFIVWGIGLAIVGCPIWSILHSRGFSGPLVAALSGAGAVYLIGWLWPPTSVAAAIEPGRVLLAMSGGIVGLVIERVAYVNTQPIRPPPAPRA